MIHDDDEVDHGGRVDHDDDGHNVEDIHDDENSVHNLIMPSPPPR